MSPCSRQPEIHRYHDGELPPAAAAELEAHLAACPVCAGELAELRALSAQLVALPLPPWPDAARRQAHRRLDRAGEPALLRLAGSLTAAAAAVLLTCSVQLYWFGRTDGARLLGDANWELVALTPPTDDALTFGDAQVARWMADDLAGPRPAASSRRGPTSRTGQP